MYGFGNTPALKDYTLQDYCDGAIELINHLSLEDVTVIGHSFGGRVAIRLAASCDKIKSIVLIDSAGMKPRLTLKKIFRNVKYKLRKALRMNTSSCGSSDYRALAPDMRKTFINVIHTYQEEELRHINIPTLIIWGKRDKDTPMYMAKRLARGIKGARLAVLDGGHYSYVDSHSAFIMRLRSFLNGVYFG